MNQFPNLNRMFAGRPAQRKAKTRLEIQWSDGTVTRVTKRGREWEWSTPDGHGTNYSSHLAGIRDELRFRELENNPIQGALVRVPV
jgi:hypothetical protein